MTLEKLIATLTTAQDQATEGEWSVSESDRQVTYAHSDGWDRIVASVRNPKNTRAIATWRNTASEVLQQLGKLDSALGRVLSAERGEVLAKHRAEQAEADRDDWKESASYWRTIAKAQIQQQENK